MDNSVMATCRDPRRSSAEYSETLVRSRARKRWIDAWFAILLFGVLVASANLGLINQKLAFKTSSGQNLFGLRDACLLLLLLFFPPGRKLLRQASLTHTALKACRYVVLTAIIALVLSIAEGRSFFNVAVEFSPFVAWCLPLVVVPRVVAPDALRGWWNIISSLGLAVSIGVLMEAVFRVPLVGTVTGLQGLADLSRSTPSGWPLMILAGPKLLAGCLRAWDHRKPGLAALNALGWLVVVVASLLTQSRTMLVGIIAGMMTFVLLTKSRRTRGLLLIVMATIPVWIGIGGAIGERFIGSGFSTYYVNRYAALSSGDNAVEYAPSDGRSKEISQAFENLDKWIWTGTGFAGAYTDTTQGPDGTGQLAHNTLLYFGTRFGLFGIVLYVWFMTITIKLARVAPTLDRRQDEIHAEISAGMISLIICSMFATVFASTYLTPIALVAFGLQVSSASRILTSSRRFRAIG